MGSLRATSRRDIAARRTSTSEDARESDPGGSSKAERRFSSREDATLDVLHALLTPPQLPTMLKALFPAPVERPRSMLKLPSIGFIMCVMRFGGGEAENQTKSASGRGASSGLSVIESRKREETEKVESADGLTRTERTSGVAPASEEADDLAGKRGVEPGAHRSRASRAEAPSPNLTASSVSTAMTNGFFSALSRKYVATRVAAASCCSTVDAKYASFDGASGSAAYARSYLRSTTRCAYTSKPLVFWNSTNAAGSST
mmetsp:Transcript_19247/g.76629  ORF Transcript_19247/g.76629 Transcript_19247/m.76629 type:complete len:259 (+) Transcript_19247:63-839(+)